MYKRSFPAQLASLHSMLQFIHIFGKQIPISSDLLNKITLASEEALVNIINYGYPHSDGVVEITCEYFHNSRKGIKIKIQDQGIPFNPLFSPIPQKVPPKNSLDNLDTMNLGGYGIYIFFRIMDKIEYQRFEEVNVLTLIKYLA